MAPLIKWFLSPAAGMIRLVIGLYTLGIIAGVKFGDLVLAATPSPQLLQDC